jgi:tetratricopeptide (TPR) repeat protein
VVSRASIALTRCYREAGDLTRSIERGEALLSELAVRELDGTTEAVQLAVTIAAAHFERGDAGHAVRLCRRAIGRAEEMESPGARASAYWNASIMESEQGNVARAIPLARQALTLLDHEADNRSVARLRSQLGIFLLSVDPPEVESARATLEMAARELEGSSASLAERLNNQLSWARALLMGDDVEGAREILRTVMDQGEAVTPMVQADTLVLLGQIDARAGRMDAARERYQTAAQVLTGTGADRRAAQLWFELGSLFEEAGDQDSAGDAFRRAAVSTGLVRTPTRTFSS